MEESQTVFLDKPHPRKKYLEEFQIEFLQEIRNYNRGRSSEKNNYEVYDYQHSLKELREKRRRKFLE